MSDPSLAPSAPQVVRKILFVEENLSYYEMMKKVLSAWSRDQWQFFHATNPGKALKVFEANPIDLVVIDQRLTTIDGLQFLKILKQRHPGLRKAVLTSEPDEEKKAIFIDAGVDVYLEKPASIDGMESVFATLDELAKWRSEEGFRGVIHGVRIKAVLQMLCFGRNSAVLEIVAGETEGRIYVQEGFVLHAEAQEHTGELALGLLLNFEHGSFTLGPLVGSPPQLTLSLGWNALDGLPLPALRSDEPDLHQKTEDSSVIPSQPAKAGGIHKGLVPEIAEMLVCSAEGTVLFHSQCNDSHQPAELLVEVAKKSEQLGEILPVGTFNRLEVEAPDGRALFHAKPNGLVYVQISRPKDHKV